MPTIPINTYSKEDRMKGKLTAVFVTLLLLGSAALSQWSFVRAYTPFRSPRHPNDLWGAHGVVVDPSGKIWVAPYDVTDTVSIGPGTLQARRQIFVFNRDGSAASFSPIRSITVGSVTDSLNNDNSARGLSRDNAGNILYSSFNRVFKLNYTNGQGIARVDAHPGSITAAGSDNQGNVYVGRVAATGLPVKIFTPTLSFLANAIDSAYPGFSRTLLVSGDGTRIYHAIFDKKKIYVYRNDLGPGFGTYALVDSLAGGLQVESMTWQPRGGSNPVLWASSGSRNNPPDSQWTTRSWYGFNTTTKQVVDSIKWGATFPGNPSYDDTVVVSQSARPRGIAFTSTGDTAYVAMYLADSNSVKMFRKTTTSVNPVTDVLPSAFDLSQNYPNPFNPSTEIKFSVVKAGQTTLKVYDVLGREVATLVDENLNPGAYSTTFDASRFSSGTYIYTLTQNGQSVSKKMLLVR